MAAKKTARQWQADELVDLLAKKYAAPEYAFLEQVRNGTGAFANRSADAMALSLWPSRGLKLEGFEVKVYRGDWLKEMRSPAKAEELARYCDRWWIVAPADIVKLEELPPNWGLLVPYGQGLKVAKDAPYLEAQELDRMFIAALLRNVTEKMVHQRHIKKQVDDAAEKKISWERSSLAREIEAAAKLKARVDAFEKASGVQIDMWGHSGTEIGKTVRMILDGKHKRLNDDAARVRSRIYSLLCEFDKMLDEEGIAVDKTAKW